LEIIADSGYNAFFAALLKGHLKLGQIITQEQLCSILGMSMSPLRDTMALLEAEGLIQIRRRIGVKIFYPDVKFVGSTFQFRGLLEREGLKKFSTSVTDGWIKRITTAHHDVIDFVESTKNASEYEERVKALEDELHWSFINVFDNAQINSAYARLSQKMYLLRLLNVEAVGPASTTQSMHEHLAIIDALRMRKADDAVEALERHLQGVLHRILAS
jgi:DNA-binding GntR family transcriptional regulator